MRLLKFQAVGAIGVAAQLAALALLHEALRLGILTATALAVEFSILHNFFWHECWTWRDRTAPHPAVGLRWVRLLRFQATAGAISLVVNLAGMRVLHGACGLPYLEANLLSIAAGAAANYLAADFFVFAVS